MTMGAEQMELRLHANAPIVAKSRLGGSFYEFFAGAGMARAGLGDHWRCLFANDFDAKKAASYRLNWPGDGLLCRDIHEVAPAELPQMADLAWASFPCQDLSLAGAYAGLKGQRSSAFWPFWKLMTALGREGRAPAMVVIENVCGALTSRKGADFVAICDALSSGGYRFGCLVVDAALFVPQSRPRLFFVAVRDDISIPSDLADTAPSGRFHTAALKGAYLKLPAKLKQGWIWWNAELPPPRNLNFADIVEDSPDSVRWHTAAETDGLLGMMSDLHLAKVQEAKRRDCRAVGTLYKRTRRDGKGCKVQRAEVRFDGTAGCLRTPSGGSSRQFVVVVENGKVRTRLISCRETARLMGIADDYVLPDNYNDAYHLTGDGVVVPVVRHLACEILEPMLTAAPRI